MISKQQLRQAFRTNLERDADLASFAERSSELTTRLASFMAKRSGVWAGFMPVGFEPDISKIFTMASHLSWAFPRVEGDSLAFYIPEGPLVTNQWKIPEPDPKRAKLVPFNELAGVLVPGLAFDVQCNRLGRGRGYYDRVLGAPDFDNNTVKVGIGFERQIASTLPTDPHDQAMDWVITESRTIERKHS